MKKTTILLISLLFISIATMAQVTISEDGSSADASAMLDVKSTSKGFLMPRMTEGQIASVSNPAAGLTVFNTNDNRIYIYDDGSSEWKEVALSAVILVPTVYNPTTGKTWMDRNLGASQVATSSTDTAAYGNLYQWGRATEGHETRTSSASSTNASTAIPNDGNSWDGLFITEGGSPYDWLVSQDDNLWQGVTGTNNPCPSGFRLPTTAEWDAERLSWATSDTAGAFGSPLKLTVNGYRYYTDGSLTSVGNDGDYWGSTTSNSWFGKSAVSLYISSGSAGMYYEKRAYGFSVRCIKD